MASDAQWSQHRVDVEELVAANAQSNKTMLALIATVREETAARDRKLASMEQQQKSLRLAIVLVTIGVSILICVGVINAINLANTKKQQDRLTSIGEEVDQTNKTLLDCLNSQGTCGAVNAANQKALLNEVKKYELTGFYCIRLNPATKDPAAEEFLKCMQRLYPGGPTLERR